MDLAAARSVVAEALVPTPLWPVTALAPGASLKLENHQPTGSFKVRGALAAVAAAPPTGPIITASAGNHGIAIAWAARRLGRRATVVIPKTASRAKVDALRSMDCELEYADGGYDEAEAHAIARAESGFTYISAYNDTHVIAGQSTIGAELEEIGEPVTLFVPVGGGGLISGICLWAMRRPEVRIVGVETAASPGMSTAIRAGRVERVDVGPTLADGLAGNLEEGSVTVEITASRVDEMVAVTEEEIRAAMRFLAAQHGQVVEGSGAAGVAALLASRAARRGRPVALVTGRNVALSTFSEVMADAPAE
ncbi:threonine ammonia-lyase [Nonomuraea sp. LPB2021202275-12-8]|uniref:threonine ammonia-lyase n=1 Tax=Nonomuraea sp. LPB2021202275-12-8 TaxID=3120159 RepID=UPI00300C96D3